MPKLKVFTVAEYKSLMQPCVYAWMRNSEYLYVGFSKRGLSRLLTHDLIGKKQAIELEDQFLYWEFESEQEATECELKLILEHKPRFNKYPFEMRKVKRKGLRPKPAEVACVKCSTIFQQTRSLQKHCAPCRQQWCSRKQGSFKQGGVVPNASYVVGIHRCTFAEDVYKFSANEDKTV